MNTNYIKSLRLFLLTLFFTLGICTNAIQAQTYASQRLQYIGEMLPAKTIPQKDSVFYCSQVINGKMLVVGYNAKNEISHLGVSMFSNESKILINKPVCDFIERIMLDFVLNQKQNNLANKLEEYKITLTKVEFQKGQKVTNIISLLNTMKEPVNFTLNHKEESYTAVWDFGVNEQLYLSFPANRELIFGTNKKEVEFEINEELTNQKCRDTIIFTAEQNEINLANLNHLQDSIYQSKGNFFILPQLNNHIFYSTTKPLFSPQYPEYSLKNILLNYDIVERNQKIISPNLHIKHRMYGNFTPEFYINLSDFQCYFQRECESFCFVEQEENNKLTAYLILHSATYNYIHLLIITTDKQEIFKENPILKAEFYTNIPQNNIKSLF